MNTVNQPGYFYASNVIYGKCHLARVGQIKGDGRTGIKWIGVGRVKGEFGWLAR